MTVLTDISTAPIARLEHLLRQEGEVWRACRRKVDPPAAPRGEDTPDRGGEGPGEGDLGQAHLFVDLEGGDVGKIPDDPFEGEKPHHEVIQLDRGAHHRGQLLAVYQDGQGPFRDAPLVEALESSRLISVGAHATSPG